MNYYLSEFIDDNGDYYHVYCGPERDSPHSVLIAVFYDEQEAYVYCNFKNNLETFDDPLDDSDGEDGYEELEF